MHEDGLVGTQLHASSVVGSFDDGATFHASPPGASEYDLEQDVFGAVRVLERGQLALLVPAVATVRRAQGVTELGGGWGDVNASARYDFTLAGRSLVVPGIAGLVGVTLPTGVPPDEATKPLATDATGVGAWQGNVGLALEQSFGPWLFNATSLLAWRAARSVRGIDEALGPQLVMLLGGAYAFPNDAALALLFSYTLEGEATIDGEPAAGTARHVALISASGVYPVTDAWRLQGSVLWNPPISGLGRNQPATAGLTLTVIRSFS